LQCVLQCVAATRTHPFFLKSESHTRRLSMHICPFFVRDDGCQWDHGRKNAATCIVLCLRFVVCSQRFECVASCTLRLPIDVATIRPVQSKSNFFLCWVANTHWHLHHWNRWVVKTQSLGPHHLGFMRLSRTIVFLRIMVDPPVGKNNLITRVQRLAGGRYYEKRSNKVSHKPYAKLFGSVLFIIRECSGFHDHAVSRRKFAFFRATLK